MHLFDIGHILCASSGDDSNIISLHNRCSISVKFFLVSNHFHFFFLLRLLKARECRDLSTFVDNTAGESAMRIGNQMMDLALQCIDIGRKRPSITSVVYELEQIQKREMGLLISEDIGAVKLGSELFR